MKDLIPRSKALLKSVAALESEFDADPFHAEFVESQGAVTAAQTLLEESEKEPDSLSPEEIVAARQSARNALEIATITHKRAKAKCDQFAELLGTKVSELKDDALPVVTDAWVAYQSIIVEQMFELGGGFFNRSSDFGPPQQVARHRGQVLEGHKTMIDGRGFGPQTSRQKLLHIRDGLESVIAHLS